MARVLIAFLGRGLYREAGYVFDEETLEHQRAGTAARYRTTFFGVALIKHLVDLKRRPDKVVVFGTSGSYWDNFFGTMLREDLAPDRRDDLQKLSQAEEVTAAHLAELQPAVAAAMRAEFGTQSVELRILPSYLVSEAEQVGLVQELMDVVNPRDRIVLDVTHGFRHLPLLGCFAALSMRGIRDAVIEGIYYGALDMTRDGQTPVVRLDGLLQIADWVSAFSVASATGDLGAFGPALERSAAADNVAADLRNAMFWRNSGQFPEAIARFERVGQGIRTAAQGSPLVGVFQRELTTRLASLGQDPYAQTRAVALEALAKGRLEIAAAFGLDAARLRIMAIYPPVAALTMAREATQIDAALTNDRTVPKSTRESFFRLRSIRNWFSHSGQVGEQHLEVERAMTSFDTCRSALEIDLNRLLPPQVGQSF